MRRRCRVRTVEVEEEGDDLEGFSQSLRIDGGKKGREKGVREGGKEGRREGRKKMMA